MNSPKVPQKILIQIAWITLAFAGGAFGAAFTVSKLVVPAATIEQAAALADNEQWADLIKCLERMPSPRRTDPQVLVLWTRAYSGLDQVEAALSVVRQIPSGSPLGHVARFQEGRLLWELRQAAAAERAWNECLKLSPSHVDARWHLLMLYDLQERRSDAVQVATDLMRYDPDPLAPLMELIRQDAERLAPRPALEIWKASVAVDADDFHALRLLGKSHVLMGSPEEGIPFIEEAVARRPAELTGRETLLWAMFESGDMTKVETVLSQLPAAAAEIAWSWSYRGRMHESRGSVSDAIECYEQSLRLDPYDRKTHYQLARAYRRAGQENLAGVHDETSRQLDQSREALHNAYAHLSKHRYKDRDASVVRHIANLCEQLGRNRESDAWNQLIGGRRPQPSM